MLSPMVFDILPRCRYRIRHAMSISTWYISYRVSSRTIASSKPNLGATSRLETIVMEDNCRVTIAMTFPMATSMGRLN